jgi:hypothetical protein
MIVAQIEGQPFIRWDWVWDHTDLIWSRLVEHLFLTGIALIVGFAISIRSDGAVHIRPLLG